MTSSNALEASRRLYQILSIADFSTTEEVRVAYKTMALRYHPDKNLNDPTAADKFREVLVAYEVLSDDARKRRYDVNLRVFKSTFGGGFTTPSSGAANSGVYRGSGANPGTSRGYTTRSGSPFTYAEYCKMGGCSQEEMAGASSHARTGSVRSGGGTWGQPATKPEGSMYTKEQQELFRRKERERQAELRRQREAERKTQREQERELLRREQQKREELLRQRWQQQQQQRVHAAAVAAGAASSSGTRRRGDTPRAASSTPPPPNRPQSGPHSGGGGVAGTHTPPPPPTSIRVGTPQRGPFSASFRYKSSAAAAAAMGGVRGPTDRGGCVHGTPASARARDHDDAVSSAGDLSPRPTSSFPQTPAEAEEDPSCGASTATSTPLPTSRQNCSARPNTQLNKPPGGFSPFATPPRSGVNTPVKAAKPTRDGAWSSPLSRHGTASPVAGAAAAGPAGTPRSIPRSYTLSRDDHRQLEKHRRVLRAKAEQQQKQQQSRQPRRQSTPTRKPTRSRNSSCSPETSTATLSLDEQLMYLPTDETTERDQLITREEVCARNRIVRAFSQIAGDLLFAAPLAAVVAAETAGRRALLQERQRVWAAVACHQEESLDRRHYEGLERKARRRLLGREASDVYHASKLRRGREGLLEREEAARQQLCTEAAVQWMRLVTVSTSAPQRAWRAQIVATDAKAREDLYCTYRIARVRSAVSSRKVSGSSSAQSVQTPSKGRSDSAGRRGSSTGRSTSTPEGSSPRSALRALLIAEAAARTAMASRYDSGVVAALRQRARERHHLYTREREAAVAEARRTAAREVTQLCEEVERLRRAMNVSAGQTPTHCESSPSVTSVSTSRAATTTMGSSGSFSYPSRSDVGLLSSYRDQDAKAEPATPKTLGTKQVTTSNNVTEGLTTPRNSTEGTQSAERIFSIRSLSDS